MRALGLLVFDDAQARAVIEGMGLEVTPKGRVAAKGHAIHCNACRNSISIGNFGGALPGSRLYYCDDPSCLVEYVNKKLAPVERA